MRRKIWKALGRKTVLDKVEHTVTGWSKSAPVEGLTQWVSALWGSESRGSDSFEIADVHIEEADVYTEVVEQPVVRQHNVPLDSRPIKHWMFSHREDGMHIKLPLSYQVRKYHSSPVAYQKREEEGIIIDGEDDVEVPVEQAEPITFKYGTSDFRKLRMTDAYVDRSEFVRAFENGSFDVGVNTFPRRFQKSANLSILKYFYEIEVDERGEQLPREERQNPVLFAGTKAVGIDSTAKFLEPLRVSAYPDIMSKQGTIPVISADFQGVSGDSYEKAFSGIKRVLHNTWDQHSYLLNSAKLRANEQALVERYVDPVGYVDLTEEQVISGLQDLSKFLYTHFGVPVIALVDEYDTAINRAYMNRDVDLHDAKKIIGLHREIFGAVLKGNDAYLYKGLVTGILRIAKANIFSGLNNLGEYSMGDDAFSGLYGFTQEDVDELVVRFNIPPELASGFRNWYNGYDVGELIYNPWSVANAVARFRDCKDDSDMAVVQKKVLQNYWQASGNLDFVAPLFKHPSVEESFRKLSEGDTIEFGLNRQISVNDFMVLREMLGHPSSYEITPYGQRILYSYLFASGYLTPNGKEGFYRAPNKEARDEFAQRLMLYYEETYKLDISFFRRLTDQIQLVFNAEKDGEYEVAVGGIRKTLNALLENLPGFVKLDKDEIEPVAEGVLHGNESLIQGIISHASMQVISATQFGTEVYVGDGRTDCLIIDDRSKKAIIFELKYNTGDASGAVVQIGERGYARPIPEGYDVVNIGLNVDYDKTVSVEHEVDRGGTSGIIDMLGDVVTPTYLDSESEVIVSGDHDPNDGGGTQ